MGGGNLGPATWEAMGMSCGESKGGKVKWAVGVNAAKSLGKGIFSARGVYGTWSRGVWGWLAGGGTIG